MRGVEGLNGLHKDQNFEQLRKQFLNRSARIDSTLSAFVLSKLTEATLARLPAKVAHGMFLKIGSGELGPLSKAQLLARIREAGFPSDSLLRFKGDVQWQRVSEFFRISIPVRLR